MKTFVKYSVLSAVTLGLAGLALAVPAAAKGNHGGREGARFERFDTDADGFVTAEEMGAVRLARFTEQDADKDGFLSLEELQAKPMKRFGGQGRMMDDEETADRSRRMLRYLDENGDGKVAFDEMPSRDGRMIARLDADEDGKISRAEFDQARAQFRKGHEGEGHGDEHHGPRHQ